MKKVNLLSKIQMKKVLGGNRVAVMGCESTLQCPSGQWCCTDMSDPSTVGPKKCQTPVLELWPDIPGSPGGTYPACPGGGWE